MEEPKKYRIPWSGRSVTYTKQEIAAVVRVMTQADPLTQGQYLLKFEKEFSKYLGVKNSFAVANCTCALELAAILCSLKKGDEVIIPAHTFCATAIPFARTGAKIVWADIDPKTRVVSAETILKCLSKKTKVIVVVHLYGLMAEMNTIIKLAKERNILVVEDCAQAIGAEYKGKKTGTFGDFACFSFHCQKSLNTLGEGGMLVVKSNEKSKLVPGLRHNGVRGFGTKREHYWLPAMSNVDLDINGVLPYNFCITEAQCALGIEVLKGIDKANEKRRKRAQIFIERMKDFPELSFQEVKDKNSHVYHLLTAKYNGDRNRLIEILVEKYKIKAIVQFHPLYRYPLFKKIGLGKANCPATDDFFDNMISFPFHLWMSDSDFEYMVNSTKKALTELCKK